MIRKLFLFVVLIFSFLLTACGLNQSHILETELGLSSIQSQKELQEKLNSTSYYWRYYGSPILDGIVGATAEDTNVPNGQEEKSSDYTTTNVQVEGVDEGDRVKTDGDRIYSLNNNAVKVVDVNEGHMELVFIDYLNEDISNQESNYYYYYYSNYFTELYLTDQYFIAIFASYSARYYIDWMPLETSGTYTGVRIYDKETFDLVEEYNISGSLNTSRLIEDQLYLILNHYDYSEERNNWPWVKVDGVTTTTPLNDIKYLPNTVYESYTVIAKVTLQDEVSLETDVLLGPSYWQQIYVSQQSIYLTTQQYEETLLGNYTQTGLLVSYLFNESGSVFFGGAGSFKGNIIDQFAMDEYDGYMRIATTEGFRETAMNRIYVFERQIIADQYYLIVVGKIDKGLGKPGETIRSARFNEEQATIVTFLQTDPLYVIDLSNPTTPTISGQLEIPGFSTYQHPWKENYIIGLGFDANELGQTTGVKLSLFDITDAENPVEVGKSLVFPYYESRIYTNALYDHKALFVDPNHDCIGMTFQSSRWNYTTYYYAPESKFVMFDVDLTREYPIQILHTVDHFELGQKPGEELEDSEELVYFYWNYNYVIDRAVRIDNYLYVISGNLMTSHELGEELTTVEILPFDPAEPDLVG
ncbi:MAG: beta-propeller domain-containing protein [Bacilli bacterium]|nr:beta-propeller domain-containing protein [Bacilli bacterium]